MRRGERGDPHGIDVAAIEHIDRRSLDVVREDGVDRRLGIDVAADRPTWCCWCRSSCPTAAPRDDLWNELATRPRRADDTPLTRLCRLLDRTRRPGGAEIALPADHARAAAFVELREAVPAGVNRRVALRACSATRASTRPRRT